MIEILHSKENGCNILILGLKTEAALFSFCSFSQATQKFLDFITLLRGSCALGKMWFCFSNSGFLGRKN